MMRSTEPNEQTIAPASLPDCRSTIVSGVCSECGTTYQVEVSEGHESWMCPRCGPSTPIAGRELIERTATRRRRRLRKPSIRIPFFLVQLLIVSLTFVVFMGFLLNYMSQRFPPRRDRQRRPPIAQQTPGTADHAQDPGSAAPIDRAIATDEDSSVAHTAPQAESVVAQAAPTNDGSDAARQTATVQAGPANDFAVQLALDVPPIPPHDRCVTIRDIVDHSPRWFGQEVVLQCRLAKICDDAIGKVPRRFDVDGQRIQIDEQEESEFVRMEIVDVHGESMQSVFARTDGRLGPVLQWIMPGDWLRLTATPGLRYSEASAGSDWGLVVLRVEAIDENSHDFTDGADKQLAERP